MSRVEELNRSMAVNSAAISPVEPYRIVEHTNPEASTTLHTGNINHTSPNIRLTTSHGSDESLDSCASTCAKRSKIISNGASFDDVKDVHPSVKPVACEEEEAARLPTSQTVQPQASKLCCQFCNKTFSVPSTLKVWTGTCKCRNHGPCRSERGLG
jgi:hypothetical protein